MLILGRTERNRIRRVGGVLAAGIVTALMTAASGSGQIAAGSEKSTTETVFQDITAVSTDSGGIVTAIADRRGDGPPYTEPPVGE